jgi:hypothetical protein
MMYVRNKAEALDVVAAILALPERKQQIIQLTVRVAMCLDPEARRFLGDCQAGLIDGGLEAMRKRRLDLVAAQQKQEEAPEAFVIVDSSTDQLLEQVGMALDALRLADIVRQVFPQIREREPAWMLARLFLASEQEIRELTIQAVKAHGAGDGKTYDAARDEIQKRLDGVRPTWMGAVSTLQAACEEASPGDSRLLAAVAVDDMRAQLVLDLLASNREEALAYLRDVQQRIDTLARLEAESK